MSKVTLTRAQVAAATGFGAPEIDRLCEAGEFPQPMPLGPWTTGWAKDDVDAWLQAQRRDSAARRPGKAEPDSRNPR